jgi:dihydroorotase (multifunctional complex type)
MQADIIVGNARFFDSASRSFKTGTIAIKNGQILSTNAKGDIDADTKVDAAGKLVLPGFVDLHVHLRDLEQSYKETIATGTRAAIHGGVTSVLCMPNTKPPLTTQAAVLEYMARARQSACCNVAFMAGVPEDPDDLARFKEAGVHGIKIYMEHSLEGFDWDDDAVLHKALEAIYGAGLPVHVHPGRGHDRQADQVRFQDLLDEGIPPLVAHSALFSDDLEAAGLDRMLRLTGSIADGDSSLQPRLHACHVSSRAAIETLQAWKPEMGGLLSSEVTPHHLFLNNEMAFEPATVAKVLQPLRAPAETDFLVEQLRNGTIDAIASDHAPHSEEEKAAPFFDALSGFPSLDTHVQFLLSAFGTPVPWDLIIRRCCEAPAAILGVGDKKGQIRSKYDADIVIVEQVHSTSIDVDSFQSQSKMSPFALAGMALEWRVVQVIVDGVLAVDDGVPVEAPCGRLILGSRANID